MKLKMTVLCAVLALPCVAVQAKTFKWTMDQCKRHPDM